MTDHGKSIYQSIEGGPKLLSWFGRVPSFHDAEVLALNLERAGKSRLTLHGWNMTDTIDDKGFFFLDQHAVVTFHFEDVVDLQLEGFSHQNVINDLSLSRVSTGPSHDIALSETYEILIEPCYGISGFIHARTISVSFVPGKP